MPPFPCRWRPEAPLGGAGSGPGSIPFPPGFSRGCGNGRSEGAAGGSRGVPVGSPPQHPPVHLSPEPPPFSCPLRGFRGWMRAEPGVPAGGGRPGCAPPLARGRPWGAGPARPDPPRPGSGARREGARLEGPQLCPGARCRCGCGTTGGARSSPGTERLCRPGALRFRVFPGSRCAPGAPRLPVPVPPCPPPTLSVP